MQAPDIVIGPTEFFVLPRYDAHVIDYRWNKRMVAAQLDKRADNLKIEVAKIVARINLRRNA
jgi:hypothetical protein